MKPINEMTIAELGAYVCTHLYNHGIKCVLSGGACVSIYTQNKYESYDLDFIDNLSVSRNKIKQILFEIGFEEENRYFKHNDTKYFIEFPKGPLAIGSEQVSKINELELLTGKLFLLTPTDCVKDRLAAYYYWDDLQSLNQAILVVRDNEIDIGEIKRWSKVENQIEKFIRILPLLQGTMNLSDFTF